MLLTRILIFLLLFLFLSACNSKQEIKVGEIEVPVINKNTSKVKDPIQKESAKINEVKDVVARVNKSEISQAQLEYAMNRLLPNQLGDDERKKLSAKVLDSLIDSRLMANLEKEAMNLQELKLLNLKVEAYKEELLAKKYITENITPQPITRDAVYQYYLDHQKEFGSDTKKEFEVIQTTLKVNDQERKSLFIELSSLSEVQNWSTWFASNKHLGITYKRTTSLVGLLKDPLKTLVENTDKGETSPIHNSKVISIVRVNDVVKIAAKPFEQVSRKIRRKMAPQALKTSIKKHLVDLKKNASIEKLLVNSNSEDVNITVTKNNESSGIGINK